MANFSHLAILPFKNFPFRFIHTTHAALNLGPITHDHPLGNLSLSLFLHGHTISYCIFFLCCGNKSGCCTSWLIVFRMELINVRNSCRSPLQFLFKVETLHNLADHELMFKTAAMYLNNRLVSSLNSEQHFCSSVSISRYNNSFDIFKEINPLKFKKFNFRF